mmetsp:Transcript_414/g.760  ORF Transcript_414/g.760 Transcript_414/m.760 type:complete len:84 (-) Transcript_414:1048-1299(-)
MQKCVRLHVDVMEAISYPNAGYSCLAFLCCGPVLGDHVHGPPEFPDSAQHITPVASMSASCRVRNAPCRSTTPAGTPGLPAAM